MSVPALPHLSLASHQKDSPPTIQPSLVSQPFQPPFTSSIKKTNFLLTFPPHLQVPCLSSGGVPFRFSNIPPKSIPHSHRGAMAIPRTHPILSIPSNKHLQFKSIKKQKQETTLSPPQILVKGKGHPFTLPFSSVYPWASGRLFG